ncbi:zinc finger HIT domain-containing protein 3 isoform X3 [Varanus komodoensis]|uniref:zinc finger HIT domain-containing protein 3 isoform X3 n=1 Tax=Varanus komodoensis TaxID=61221 RepID=UPI001CF7A742|nr:zinc finger HIT domain-containing protein 3 isoform X3 [Varanus komodoensis]
MPKASEPCVVCGEGGPGAAKYRCPGCRLRYCSLPCYKKHKEQCQGQIYHGAQPAKPEISWDAQEERSVNAEGSTWSVDNILTDDDEDDKVPLEKLQLLKNSVPCSTAALKNCWPHAPVSTPDSCIKRRCLWEWWLKRQQ